MVRNVPIGNTVRISEGRESATWHESAATDLSGTRKLAPALPETYGQDEFSSPPGGIRTDENMAADEFG